MRKLTALVSHVCGDGLKYFIALESLFMKRERGTFVRVHRPPTSLLCLTGLLIEALGSSGRRWARLLLCHLFVTCPFLM